MTTLAEVFALAHISTFAGMVDQGRSDGYPDCCVLRFAADGAAWYVDGILGDGSMLSPYQKRGNYGPHGCVPCGVVHPGTTPL